MYYRLPLLYSDISLALLIKYLFNDLPITTIENRGLTITKRDN